MNCYGLHSIHHPRNVFLFGYKHVIVVFTEMLGIEDI